MTSNFHFPNPKTTVPRERFAQRVLEMVPGTLSWATLLGMLALSFLQPVVASVFIITFDIYWIYRTVFVSYYSLKGHFTLREGKKINWWERCQNIEQPVVYAEMIRDRIRRYREAIAETPIFQFRDHLVLRKWIWQTEAQLREVEALIPIQHEILDWRKIIHVVLLPTAGESAEIIEPAIQSLLDVNFPKEQMIVVLATEERENPETRLPKVEYLTKKFAGQFKDFIVTTHIVEAGEMKCKASNAAFAARYLMGYFDERNIDYQRVLFSNFDCDTVAHPEYFAALTYAFITDPKRLQRAYQPIPVYHNNLWDTNAFVRLAVTGSSFWHLYQSTRREMVTFSSHSESFDTLVKVGFWPLNMISEDSVIYWKCLSYFDGDYEVKPIHLPVSLDAVLANTYTKTIQNQYKQLRRWAYGIENWPVTMRAIWPNPRVPFRTKLRVSFEMLEGHHSWATTSFILAFLGWLPLVLGGEAFREGLLAHNLPLVTQTLMTLAMMGMMVSVPLSMVSLPPKPSRYHWTRYSLMLLQWILAPLVAFLSALPALDSQTRLLFGQYFGEFWVTEKVRRK